MRVILVILLLLSVSYQQVVKLGIAAWFYANQTNITEKYCENKNKPDLKCNGKCYLGKQLKKTEDRSRNEDKAPAKKVKFENQEFTLSIQYRYISFFLAEENIKPVIESCLVLSPFIGSVFHPPARCK